nr:MAG TPA: hypothetical protein [Bacteriophage sp.]DAP33014.1 MAG TPA: hypothetical protein [Caudoviricetes sp.]
MLFVVEFFYKLNFWLSVFICIFCSLIIPVSKLICKLRSKYVSFHSYSFIFSVFFFELIE